MGDVIEASADGGFDIPTTPDPAPPSRLTTRSSTVVDCVAPKSRRVRIELDDDDDDDDTDDNENYGGRDIPTPTAPAEQQALAGEKGLPSNAPHSKEVDHAEKVENTAAPNLPEYRIYEIETPGEDPMVEIVFSFSDDSLAAPISTTVATAKWSASEANVSPSRAAKNYSLRESRSPSVEISSDGGKVVVEFTPATNTGDGTGAGAEVQRRFSLKLPRRVVPGTAKIFFWQGDLTVTATLVAAE